jgi:putative peptide zinc metalloprotease protein
VSKRKMSQSLRLLYGLIPLAILIGLFSPASASATVTRPTGTPGTYVNLAKAVSQYTGPLRYSVRFQLRESYDPVINADNTAIAQTSGCHDCGAIALAFQVIFAPAQSVTALNADNTANATSTSCVRCTTLAEAYQIVDFSQTQSQLTFEQLQGLYRAYIELGALQFFHLTADQIQSRVAAIADQVVAILQNPDGLAPTSRAPMTKAAARPALRAASTRDIQPGVELFVKIQNAPAS